MIGECSVSASDWQKPPRITDGRRHAIGPGDPENHRDVHLWGGDSAGYPARNTQTHEQTGVQGTDQPLFFAINIRTTSSVSNSATTRLCGIDKHRHLEQLQA